MHQEIIQVRKGRVIDHRNSNGVDNRCANLREATYSQNGRNRGKARIASSSKYKGVSWNKRSKRWFAYINRNRKKIHLGCFTDEIAAAKAYDQAAKKYHEEFACLNFPEKQPSRLANLYTVIRKKYDSDFTKRIATTNIALAKGYNQTLEKTI
jgi:hypothetical protein